jgi:lipopolysaccharide transport system permease protein
MSVTETAQDRIAKSFGPPIEKDDGPMTIIRARKGWIGVNWREMFARHELLTFLIWRDVKVKYKQAILGFAWAIFVPLISVLLFTVIGKAAGFDKKISGDIFLHDGTVLHGTIAKTADTVTVSPKGKPAETVPLSAVAGEKIIPYAVFVYAGMLPWLFLQACINNGGMSLVSQQQLLTKIYMPRLFMPTASVGSALVDMGLSTIVFIGMMTLFGVAPSVHVWAVIPLLLLAIITGLGFAYLLSAATVNYRDLRFLIPFFSQILMWMSGAMYPPRIFDKHENWLIINPFYGIISAFRSAILGEPWNITALSVSIAMVIAIFIFGLFYFRKAERRFADIA